MDGRTDGDASVRKRGESAFAERFADLFTESIYAIAALGVMLAWIWMGLTEGYPAFMDAAVDTVSVVLMLASFSSALVALGFVRRLDALLARPVFWVVAGGCVAVSCLVALGLFCGVLVVPDGVRLVLTRALAVPVGLGAGVIVMCCAVVFACLRPASAAVGFFVSCTVMFIVYFTLDVCKSVGSQLVEGTLFDLLPLLAALLLVRSRATIVRRLALWPDQPCSFASGYRWMCSSFAVFFFAMAAKAAMEPAHEFAVASDTSVVGILLLSFLFLYLVAVKPRAVGVFRLLKRSYVVAVLVLTVCIAIAPLSLDPYASIAFNADCVVLIMVLWLLTGFVAHANEAYVCKVVGVALAAAALGMALGWTLGRAVYDSLGHERIYVSIGLACATAVFSTAGFSSKNFPYLTSFGEGAKKMQRTKEAAERMQVDYTRLLAESAGLSAREYEVLALLVEGYNAVAVADELVVSYSTARTHVRNIYKKLGVHSHAELITRCKHFADENGEAER